METNLNERKLVDDFVSSQKSKTEEETINYTKALLALELQIKEIQDDKKVIKEEAKAEGVDVAKVAKAVAVMKKTLKMNPADIFEQEKILEIIENNPDVVEGVWALLKD